VSSQVNGPQAGLPLTGERTVPGVAHENYWFLLFADSGAGTVEHQVAAWVVKDLEADDAARLDTGCELHPSQVGSSSAWSAC